MKRRVHIKKDVNPLRTNIFLKLEKKLLYAMS